MRRILVAAVAAAGLTACSSATNTPSTAPTTAVQSTASPDGATDTPAPSACTLTSKADIYVRYVVPSQPATAQELGSVNLQFCEPTFDTLASMTSTDPGYCTTAAWVSDNPGYNPDAVPAPPLKKIQAQAGAACG